MKPIIAVFGVIDDEKTTTIGYPYIRAIEESGGIPVIVPYTESEETLDRYIDTCDGFFFSGGKDVEPNRYNEKTQDYCGIIQKYRDNLEFSAFAKIFQTGKPILGVCRGCQVINVALGGTLYQDIPSQIKTDISHKQQGEKHLPSHSVSVVKNTPLSDLIDGAPRMQANSFHHQAIKTLGEGLEVMAYADDGVIEGIYLASERYLRGYQWHPERLYGSDIHNRRIFDDFIQSCL